MWLEDCWYQSGPASISTSLSTKAPPLGNFPTSSLTTLGGFGATGVPMSGNKAIPGWVKGTWFYLHDSNSNGLTQWRRIPLFGKVVLNVQPSFSVLVISSSSMHYGERIGLHQEFLPLHLPCFDANLYYQAFFIEWCIRMRFLYSVKAGDIVTIVASFGFLQLTLNTVLL